MNLVIAILLGNLMQYGTILINKVYDITEAFFKRMSILVASSYRHQHVRLTFEKKLLILLMAINFLSIIGLGLMSYRVWRIASRRDAGP
jgi:hypothetical protein